MNDLVLEIIDFATFFRYKTYVKIHGTQLAGRENTQNSVVTKIN